MLEKRTRLPKRLKKTREERVAFAFQYPTPGFDAVQKTMIGEIHLAAAATGNFVKRAEDETAKFCVHASARAHRAGFHRDIQRAVGQS